MNGTLDTLIKGGLVVNAEGFLRADVGIRQERIVEVSVEIDDSRASKVIDATGKYIMPGVIDPHSHPVYVDDIGDMSITAAFGGVTSQIHFAYVKPDMQVLPVLEEFRNDGEKKSVGDFALHLGLFDVEHQITDLEKAFQYGVTSFKVFMTYAKLQWMTDDYWLTAVMDVAAKNKGLTMVHAENGLATDYIEDKLIREGRVSPDTFTMMRPDILEAEATNRAISLARVMGSALYVVHNSAGANVELFDRVRQEGWPIIGETCPQYLTLTEEVTKKKKALAKIGPPLRTEKDNEMLWDGIARGVLHTIGSDSAAKAKSIDDDFFDAPYGSPQVETMLRMIHHRGVNSGKLSMPRLVEIMSTNVAKVFGLYPQKGVIQSGSDADIVIFDPAKREIISAAEQHSNAGYTLYEGTEILGAPILTMVRGEVVVDGKELVGKPGRAKFLETDTSGVYEGLF
ncbi:MAG: dihydropyrimidinase [Anaerolineaceae bacterium]|nr:dihydropyrimidinase [Anaerolineaceae bacterium]